MPYIGLLCLIGLALRLHGAGGWPMADDEFFSTTAALWITQDGLPTFECGGLYLRAPLFHYLSAAAVSAVDWLDPWVVLRAISALASAATGFGVFLIALRLAGPGAGIAAAGLFLLSMWSIEFGRFARMYALFGSFTVWSVYFGQRYLASLEKRDLLLSFLFVTLGTVTWAGGVFLLAVPATVWWVTSARPRSGVLFGMVSVVGVALAVRLLPRLDPGQGTTGGSSVALINPLMERIDALSATVAALLFSAGVLGAWLRRAEVARAGGWPVWTAVATALLTGAAGLILLALLVIGALLLSEVGRSPSGRRVARDLGIWAMCCAGGWTMAALLSGESMFATASFMLDYPDLWRRFLVQWWEVQPALTASLLACAAMGTVHAMRSERLVEQRFLALVVLALLAMAMMVDTDYRSTRYTYFLYPLILAYGVSAAANLIDSLPVRPLRHAVAVLALAALWWVSEDHDLRQLRDLDEYPHVFRVTMPAPVGEHYYMRHDYASAGDYINRHLDTGDKVLISHPAQSPYLEHVDYVYRDSALKEYSRLLCSDGRERWTGQPLLGSRSEVDEVLRSLEPGASLWIVQYTDKNALLPIPGDARESRRAYRSPDGKLEVIRLVEQPSSSPGSAPPSAARTSSLQHVTNTT